MSEITKNPHNIHQQIYYVLLVLFIIFVPFTTNIVNFIIILLSFHWLLRIFFDKKNLHSPFKYKITFLYLGFYLLHILALLYTEESNLKHAFFNLEVKLSFVAFPLIILSSPKLSKQQFHKILQILIFVCIAGSIVAIIKAIYQNYSENTLNSIVWKYFSNHKISGNVNIHATYFSIYLLLLIFFIIYFLYHSKNNTIRSILLLSIIYILVFMSLLGVKMMMITIFMLILVSVFLFLKTKKMNIKIFLSLVFLLVFFLSLFLSNPENLERIKVAINYQGRYSKHAQTDHASFLLRLRIWDCAFTLIQEKPLFGYGTGEAQDKLNQCYIDKNYAALYYHLDKGSGGYNAHNEYLQTYLALGFLGFLILSGLIVYLIISAFKQKNYLLLFFISLFILSALTESLFKTQKGVLFFTFFSVFLFYHKYDNQTFSKT